MEKTEATNKVQDEFTAVQSLGKRVYANGYMSMEAFNEQSMAAMDAASDYKISLEESAGMIEAISKIKGPMAVRADKSGQQAANIMTTMQNMSPEMVMAMTGGGLGKAYDWASMDKATQMSIMKSAFGGLFGGGNDSASKFISKMAVQQLTGMDDRTARTFIETGKIGQVSMADRDKAREEAKTATEEFKNARGTLDQLAKKIESWQNWFQNFAAKPIAVIIK